MKPQKQGKRRGGLQVQEVAAKAPGEGLGPEASNAMSDLAAAAGMCFSDYETNNETFLGIPITLPRQGGKV